MSWTEREGGGVKGERGGRGRVFTWNKKKKKERESYSARSSLKRGHPHSLPPASSTVPHSQQWSSPEQDRGTLHFSFPFSMALQYLFETLGANLSSCLVSLYSKGFRPSEPFMNEGRLSHKQGQKRCKITILLPCPVNQEEAPGGVVFFFFFWFI